jgi:hypothetical protein
MWNPATPAGRVRPAGVAASTGGWTDEESTSQSEGVASVNDRHSGAIIAAMLLVCVSCASGCAQASKAEVGDAQPAGKAKVATVTATTSAPTDGAADAPVAQPASPPGAGSPAPDTGAGSPAPETPAGAPVTVDVPPPPPAP